MFNLGVKVKKNELDTEIDEFGELQSVDIKNDKVKISFKRKINPKIRERKKYNKTGISQLGTTYPNPYDREEFIELSKKPINLYRYPLVLASLTILVILVDFICYTVMLAGQKSVYENFNNQLYLVAAGIAVAIDLLPIFIAHNLHRIGANRKKVLKFFNRVCLIFIITFLVIVLIFRISNSGVDEINSGNNDTSKIELYMTAEDIPDDDNLYNNIINSLIYVMIPIATSLFCFMLNYLSYDPIAKKILNKRKEVLFKQEDVNELRAVIKEMEAETDYYEFLKQKDAIMYESACNMIDSIGDYYKSYVRTEIIKKLHSPADTTDLSV